MATIKLKRTNHLLSINHSKEKGSNAKNTESLPGLKQKEEILYSHLGAGIQLEKSTHENNSGYDTQTPYALMVYGQNNLSGTGETMEVDLR